MHSQRHQSSAFEAHHHGGGGGRDKFTGSKTLQFIIGFGGLCS
jgi:hypothetical protein